MIPMRLARLSISCILLLLSDHSLAFGDYVFPEGKNVQPTPNECLKGLPGSINDGFPLQIKRSIKQYGHPCGLPKVLYESVIPMILLALHCLGARRTVYVRDRRYHFLFILSHVRDIKHEPRRVVLRNVREYDILLGPFFQDRGGKRTEGLPELNLDIDDILHIRPPGVSENAPIPQGSWAPFGPSLKPSDDLPFLEQINNPLY
jgi:hypothetical protein